MNASVSVEVFPRTAGNGREWRHISDFSRLRELDGDRKVQGPDFIKRALAENWRCTHDCAQLPYLTKLDQWLDFSHRPGLYCECRVRTNRFLGASAFLAHSRQTRQAQELRRPQHQALA